MESYIESITVYETEQKVYLVGGFVNKVGNVGLAAGPQSASGPAGGRGAAAQAEDWSTREGVRHQKWKILKFERSEDLDVVEDERLYSREELDATLQRLHQGNIQCGGLRKVAGPCPAMLGVFKWKWCYYLLLATKVAQVGSVKGNPVYGIRETALLPLQPPAKLILMPQHIVEHESMCRRLLSLVTLTKDYYFSYTWNIWSTVQDVLSGRSNATSVFDSDKVWNSWLTKSFREVIGHGMWIVPLIHGFWKQEHVSLLGQKLRLTLVGRRSREFAGTRYLKRGVNEEGYVANDVEVEQIVEVNCAGQVNSISSVVQRRGSVPLHWNQGWTTKDQSLQMKPNIRLLDFLDPFMSATRLHFDHLRCVYS